MTCICELFKYLKFDVPISVEEFGEEFVKTRFYIY